MSEAIETKNAPGAIGPYSQAIRAGNFIFVSGQIPVKPLDSTIPETVEQQARQALENLQNILIAANAGMQNVVKTTVFIKSMEDFAAINSVYAEFFSKPFPARSCVEVSALPKGVLIEIEAIASV